MSRSRPFSASKEDVRRLREALINAGFTESGVAAACGAKNIASLREVPLEVAAARTSGGTPLDTAIRLFVIGVVCPVAAVEQALAPASIERLVQGGLLRAAGGGICGTIKMVPVDGFIVCFDRSEHDDAVEAQDHVMGPSDSARTLAGITLREPVRHALDLGAGCGYLALLAARHADKVIATDINPRAAAFVDLNAALNGVTNIEARTGDRFEPVKGESFDLIFSNPPFMISPEDRITYLSGGMRADAFCAELARGVSPMLREGGHFQMTCNWVENEGVPWQDHLHGWFEGSACDTWVLRSSVTEPRTYALGWMSVGHNEGNSEARLKAWLSYYESEKITAIDAGAITMRKRSGGDPWVRMFDGPEKIIAPTGRDVSDRMRALDFMERAAKDDAALFGAVLGVSPHVKLVQECAPAAEGWAQVSAKVMVTKGFAYVEEVDTYVAELIAACDGARTLRQAIDKTAAALGWSAEDVPDETAAIVRQLVDEGFLVPVSPA